MSLTRFLLVSAAALGILVTTSTASNAEDFRQRHPRRAEVLGRDSHLRNAMNRDRGRLGGNFGALRAQQSGIRRQEQADAHANGGHITQQQQHQLNGEENTLRSQMRQDYTGKGRAFGHGYGRGGTFAQNHPRRAEVLGRDNNLNNAINRDKGQLGGNYNALKTDDRSIHQQERADARANGGYITQQQKQQLNQQENNLKQQVHQDSAGR